jgi:hypothetical protein
MFRVQCLVQGSVLFLLFIGFNAQADDGNLKSVLKKDIQKSAAKKLIDPNSGIQAWVQEATKDAKKLASEIKLSESAEKARAADSSPEAVADRLKGIEPDLIRVLTEATRKTWKEIFSDLKVALENKNIYISDIKQNSDFVAEFLKNIEEDEKQFWKERAAAEALPKTESTVEITPLGTDLGRKLKILGVIAPLLKAVDAKEVLKPGEHSELTKIFFDLKVEEKK